MYVYIYMYIYIYKYNIKNIIKVFLIEHKFILIE